MEQHSNLRFAWLREKSGKPVPPKLKGAHRLIFITYNTVYFLPIALAFIPAIGWQGGFIGFFATIIYRGIINFVRNNCLNLDLADYFLLRAP